MSRKKKRFAVNHYKKRNSDIRRGSLDNDLSLKQQIEHLFLFNNGMSYTFDELLQKMDLHGEKSEKYLQNLLSRMASRHTIKKTSSGRYVSNIEVTYCTGKVDHVNPRFAYIITPDSEEDIYVKTADLNFAIHEDLVSVMITRPAEKDFKALGKVVKILKRSKEEFVGRIEIFEKFAFVVPDARNIHFDILIHTEKIGKARCNDKVIVKIKNWHDTSNRSPKGEVVTVLGQSGEHKTEMHAIMAEFGLPFLFTKKVEQAANKISEDFTEEEMLRRRDFRSMTTFTIDPHDAKDFDDALSIRVLDEEKYEIGVHIADVSHYVKENTILDKEAIKRATSVYLVDRTIPMLPERLSNELCSLRPNEQKYTFSAVFEMDIKGKITRKWFGKTVIKSDRRFTYEEAQQRLESGKGDFHKELNTLNTMARELRKKRFERGAINFETIEVKFELDEDGKPLKVIPKERKEAHKLVEEFMLLANKEVATHIFKWNEKGKKRGSKPFVYRVHDNPDPDKLNTFSSFAARFGHKVDINKKISLSLNKLMEKIEGKPEQNILESLAIRAMAKAKYTMDPKGHFGLAYLHYTHFTSPIRRYPDIMVHRLLEHYLKNGKSVNAEDYEVLCEHSSEREKRATDAERSSIKYKQVEFMSSMLGQTFAGIISGVTEWGIFVEIIENKCEGMIRITDLDDDYYKFDERNYRWIGKNNKRIISLGDDIEVVVVRTDMERRTIDFQTIKKGKKHSKYPNIQ